MNTEQFLARVIPPGNYFAISFNKTPGRKGGFGTRFFPEGEFAQAAGFVHFMSAKRFDTYHAQASFTVAEADGLDKRNRPKFRGLRVTENVQGLRAFWIDLDVHRPGGKKAAGETYASLFETYLWLARFRDATGLPRPNLAVTSGYGLHAYWVLEDAMPRERWQPYADALKAAMVAHAFIGEAGLSSDAVRLLRPPGTTNNKTSTPMPVEAVSRLSAGDIPNATMLDALQPYLAVGSAIRPAVAGATASMAAALGSAAASTGALAAGMAGSSSVVSIFANRPTGMVTGMAAAATANLAPRRPRSFARIATQCVQAATSLAEHGEHDKRTLWYLGWLTLLHFCEDGAAYAHPIGSAHVDYDPADTGREVARVVAEVARKNNGPPTCHTIDDAKPGVCPTCPHRGRITGPWELGVEDGDLPEHYRRDAGSIEVRSFDAKGNLVWQEVLWGDVTAPLLDERPEGGFVLTLTYHSPRGSRTVTFANHRLEANSGAIYTLADGQSIVLAPGSELRFRTFLVAFIDKLNKAGLVRHEPLHPFGWNFKGGRITGFATAGTLYRDTGAVEAAPGTDRALLLAYTPQGNLAGWQQAFEFIRVGRPDLQAIVAASFGAPLMQFTGHPGMVVSAWSSGSGVGKSSAMLVGQGVWSTSQTMNSLNDTTNAVINKLATLRSLVCYWDEARVVTAEEAKSLTDMVFLLSQGKEKARMNADLSSREVRAWSTIVVMASNAPMMGHMTRSAAGTNAGAVRVFEYKIDVSPNAPTSRASNIIGQARVHHGHAGERYARWLGQHHDRAEKLVHFYVDRLNAALGADQSERLHIAGMAAMLAGAAIARKIGVAQFDVEPLEGFLSATLLELRRERERDVIVHAGVLDLEEVVGRFMLDHATRKIITSRFARVGAPGGGGAAKILWAPPSSHTVEVQVAVAEQVLRIHTATFKEWCHRHQYPGSDVVREIERRWGARTGRQTLAGGTGWAAQVACLDIPLTDPVLREYLMLPDTTVVAPSVAQAPLAGNQPRI